MPHGSDHPTVASRARRLAVLLALVLQACGSNPSETTSPDLRIAPTDGGSLAGTSWVLTRIGGEAPLGTADITLVVDDETAGGFSGCNLYGGAPAVTESTFRLDDLVATAMACHDARLMDQESEYLGILAEDSAWEVEGDSLVLGSEGPTLVFRAPRLNPLSAAGQPPADPHGGADGAAGIRARAPGAVRGAPGPAH